MLKICWRADNWLEVIFLSSFFSYNKAKCKAVKLDAHTADEKKTFWRLLGLLRWVWKRTTVHRRDIPTEAESYIMRVAYDSLGLHA